MKQAPRVDVIQDNKIQEILSYGESMVNNQDLVGRILTKAKAAKGLTAKEAVVLLNITDVKTLKQMYTAAKQLKEDIYGKRIVIFAPLYISNYCVNECEYCGYKFSNIANSRRKLSMVELQKEVKILQAMGHKRIALEAGEDLNNCSIDYVLEAISTIYAVKLHNGSIRRINVNIAATTIENYQKLRAAGIGTYILFQETYHQESYKKLHSKGPKSDYHYHITAMDRAMEAGIDDVGIGVLYGLYDYKYDTVALLTHAEYLQNNYGVGPHTISVPRLKKANNVEMKQFPHLVSDEDFKKIVAVLRLAVPYTGLILSTREEASFRERVLELGISQISAGSCTGVGGYLKSTSSDNKTEKPQFEIGDHRSPLTVIKSLLQNNYIPSYCTSCYLEGRTGDRFMLLAKSGQIKELCQPNAILTLKEFLLDYGDEEAIKLGEIVIKKHLHEINNEQIRKATIVGLQKIEAGARDLNF